MPANAMDLFTGLADPYPHYQELREQDGGVHYVEPVDMWLVLRYADGQRLTSERHRWSSSYFNTMGMGTYTAGDPVHDRYAQVMRHNLMMNDAPDHTRLRKLLNHAFTGRATKSWESTIGATVDEVLDTLPLGEPFDVFSSIGEVIPLTVIASLLGVPVEDRARFRRLSVSFASTLSPAVVGDQRDTAIRESVALFDYVQALAEQADRNELGGLIATLVRAEEDGSSLSMDELVAQVCMLLSAGNETTADLITSGVATLLAHPGQMKLLHENRDLVDSALAEVLRYRSPLQFGPRVAAEDVQDMGGKVIPKGAKVLFGWGSANRDPRRFEQPEEFDITREDRRHLAFAAGPHFCIGNQLALTEGRVFINKLLDRYSTIDPAGEPVARTGQVAFQQHGYSNVPVVVKT